MPARCVFKRSEDTIMPLYPLKYKLSAEDSKIYQVWLRWILVLYGALTLGSIALAVALKSEF